MVKAKKVKDGVEAKESDRVFELESYITNLEEQAMEATAGCKHCSERMAKALKMLQCQLDCGCWSKAKER